MILHDNNFTTVFNVVFKVLFTLWLIIIISVLCASNYFIWYFEVIYKL